SLQCKAEDPRQADFECIPLVQMRRNFYDRRSSLTVYMALLLFLGTSPTIAEQYEAQCYHKLLCKADYSQYFRESNL
ncbi:hypothetical protein CU098_004177, partial [Rhizopus stolonifer]